MSRLLLILLAVTLLAGCASRWEHATKRQADFYTDDLDCQSIAGGASEGIEPGRERISYETCMWERGWRKKATFWFFNPADQ